jgi:hypothetical protein
MILLHHKQTIAFLKFLNIPHFELIMYGGQLELHLILNTVERSRQE